MSVFRTLRNTTRIAGVVVNGALIDNAALQKMLADGERRCQIRRKLVQWPI